MKIIILLTSDLVHLSSIENVLPRGVGHTVSRFLPRSFWGG